MALPTLEKTWQHDINNVLSAANYTGTNAIGRQILLAIKNAMIGFATNPWVVVRSCDSSTADNSDLWTDTTKIVGANPGSPRSWMVLQQDGLGSGFQLLIDYVSTQSYYASMQLHVSPANGFTGGDATNRPTATDEITVGTAFEFNPGSITSAGRIHVMQSTDGECTRIVHTHNYSSVNYAQLLWTIEKPKSPVAHWTPPWLIALSGYFSNRNNLRETYLVDNENTKAYVDGAIRSLDWTVPYSNNQMLHAVNNFADEVSGDWPLYNIGLYCVSSPARGPKGELFDIWWGAKQDELQITHYPDDGTRQLCQFEHIVLPWNGDAMQIT